MIIKNGKELIIEKAKIEDAKKIIEYNNIVGGESDNLSFGKDEFHMSVDEEIEFIKDINSSNNSALFIAKIDNEIVSLAAVISSKKKRFKHQGDISISVKKAYWNLGIATIMMETLIDFAKNNQITEILHIEVRADNYNAIKLYERFGFETIGVYKNFFKINDEYFDEVLMCLYFKG